MEIAVGRKLFAACKPNKVGKKSQNERHGTEQLPLSSKATAGKKSFDNIF
jgi:hypothetical protein